MNTVEKDWRLFRSKVPEWQERYMERIINEYKELLGSDALASEKFWALENRIRLDKKSPGILLRDMSRSHMRMHLLMLIRDGVITAEDLTGFSDELREGLTEKIVF